MPCSCEGIFHGKSLKLVATPFPACHLPVQLQGGTWFCPFMSYRSSDLLKPNIPLVENLPQVWNLREIA